MLALLLLVLTGLGVFRMYFSFDWTGGQDQSGQLFTLKVRGGKSYNLFAADPFGAVFWSTQLITLMLALIMPWFRLIGGSILAVAAAGAIFYLHLQPGSNNTIPLEFEMLPPQAKGMRFEIYCHARFGGVQIYTPKACAYGLGL